MTSRRIVAFVSAFVLVFFIPLAPPASGARATDVSAASAVLMDADSGRFLYEKNSREPMLIASTTKIMTALVVLQNRDLDEVVTIAEEQTGVEGSSMYLKPDEQLTVRELLYGLLILSGNDAAEVLAVHCAGDVPSFAEQMNAKARELNLLRTHFENPHGLNANAHYSCARDLAIIAREALRNEEFRRIVSTQSISIAGRSMQSHNRLLTDYEGAVGVKTGYTMKAGHCLVSAAERDGRLLIAVTLNAPDYWDDNMAMLDDGFALFKPRTLCTADDNMGRVPVFTGAESHVSACARQSLSMPLTDEELPRVELTLRLPWYVWAPVDRGAHAGYARYLLDGRLLGQVELYYADDVSAQTPKKSFWQSLEEFIERVG